MMQNLSFWAFLATVPVLYWLLPIRFRAAFLSIASLGMLFTLAPYAIAFMLALALLVYGVLNLQTAPAFAGAGAGTGTAFLPPAISNIRPSAWMFFIVLGYLFWYKYVPQLAALTFHESGLAKIAVPLGISYYSFKLMHYALERGRENLPPHTIQEFLSWMFLLPTFTSGPIERFDHFQENTETSFRVEFVIEGVTRITVGLIKRFVIEDQLINAALHFSGDDLTAFAHGIDGQPGVFAVWAFLFLSLIVLYLDFSAYSDMAIGASRLFGFRIMENFAYPLLATNLPEFWKRWHMSLTGWCRGYVYMPLVGATRNPYTAIIVTFVLVGLWHAGTIHWLAWGLWHGCGQAGVLYWSRIAQRKRITFFKTTFGKLLGWALTLGFVSLGGTLVTFYDKGDFMDSFRLMGRAFGIV